MNRTLTTLLCLTFLGFQVAGQEVIGIAGESSTVDNHSISFTVGEPIIGTASVGQNNITQGFQQPQFTITTIEEESPDPNLKLSIYPNPTVGVLNITPSNFKEGLFEARIMDMQGRQIMQQSFDQDGASMDLSQLESANYILIVVKPDQQYTHHFQIIKSH